MAPAEKQADRGAKKGVFLAEAILQKALVGEVGQLGVVHIEYERRWITADLGAVIYFQRLPGLGRCGVNILGFLENAVNLGSSQTDHPLILDPQRRRQYLGYTLPCLC